jgi:hypothetical protein
MKQDLPLLLFQNVNQIRMKTNFFNLFRLIILGTGCTFLLSCAKQDLLSQYVTKTPVKKIDQKKATQLQENFLKLELCNPVARENNDLANNAWISMESLANYLNEVLNNPPEGITPQDISGIRIYFGQYPYDDNSTGTVTGTNQLTMFIVPTVKDNDGTDRENDRDLEVEVLNYGNAGQPPRKIFPHDGN